MTITTMIVALSITIAALLYPCFVLSGGISEREKRRDKRKHQ